MQKLEIMDMLQKIKVDGILVKNVLQAVIDAEQTTITYNHNGLQRSMTVETEAVTID